MVKPYVEEHTSSNSFYRIFSKDVLTDELVWHRDKASRVITVVEGEGWFIQLDNRLPVEMKIGDKFEIPAQTYHRVKRGVSDLKIYIQELL